MADVDEWRNAEMKKEPEVKIDDKKLKGGKKK